MTTDLDLAYAMFKAFMGADAKETIFNAQRRDWIAAAKAAREYMAGEAEEEAW